MAKVEERKGLQVHYRSYSNALVKYKQVKRMLEAEKMPTELTWNMKLLSSSIVVQARSNPPIGDAEHNVIKQYIIASFGNNENLSLEMVCSDVIKRYKED